VLEPNARVLEPNARVLEPNARVLLVAYFLCVSSEYLKRRQDANSIYKFFISEGSKFNCTASLGTSTDFLFINSKIARL
jgi:hypothetical protein